MRKLMIGLLVLAMFCGMFGCGKNGDSTTAPVYTAKDVMIYQAAAMAVQVGKSAEKENLKLLGASDQVAAFGKYFTESNMVDNVASGAILNLKNVNLHQLIVATSNKVLTAVETQCVDLLRYTTRIYCPKETMETAIYLRFGAACHYIVHFVPEEGQIVRATIYPMPDKVSVQIMSQHFSKSTALSNEAIRASYKRVKDVSYAAAPSGVQTDSAYYAEVAANILSAVPVIGKADLQKCGASEEVIAQAALYIKALTGEPASTAVYRFPDDLEGKLPQVEDTQVMRMIRQHTYCDYPNGLLLPFGDANNAANTLVQKVLVTAAPGIAAVENEAPVMVAINYGRFTAVLVIYPNENNLYTCALTCLPCDMTRAEEMLVGIGANKMQ